MIAGIDYGSKLAGTTVICYEQGGLLHFQQSQKKQDADKMIVEWIKTHKPSLVMLDAPLSLPLVYSDPDQGESYHYRICDQRLKAMSPMFLGGLTARAMQLRGSLSDWTILETYPKQVLHHRLPHLVSQYKEDIESFSLQLSDSLPYPFVQVPTDWHQVDSAMAYLAGHLYTLGKCETVGIESEGLIYY